MEIKYPIEKQNDIVPENEGFVKQVELLRLLTLSLNQIGILKVRDRQLTVQLLHLVLKWSSNGQEIYLVEL